MKSPCNACEKDTSCTYICPQFTEWFVRTWDDMVAKLRKKWGLRDDKG